MPLVAANSPAYRKMWTKFHKGKNPHPDNTRRALQDRTLLISKTQFENEKRRGEHQGYQICSNHGNVTHNDAIDQP